MNKLRLLFFVLLIMFGSCTRKKEAKAEVVWNIPALVGVRIDAVGKILGEPNEKRHIRNNKIKIYYEYVYSVDDKTLSINFNPYTRKVNNFMIIYLTGFQTKEEILRVGNLAPTTSKYLAKCEHAYNNRDVYSSVTVYPKKIN